MTFFLGRNNGNRLHASENEEGGDNNGDRFRVDRNEDLGAEFDRIGTNVTWGDLAATGGHNDIDHDANKINVPGISPGIRVTESSIESMKREISELLTEHNDIQLS